MHHQLMHCLTVHLFLLSLFCLFVVVFFCLFCCFLLLFFCFVCCCCCCCCFWGGMLGANNNKIQTKWKAIKDDKAAQCIMGSARVKVRDATMCTPGSVGDPGKCISHSGHDRHTRQLWSNSNKPISTVSCTSRLLAMVSLTGSIDAVLQIF